MTEPTYYTRVVEQKELNALLDAGMFALGWCIGKEGKDAAPVRALARALKDVGLVSPYLDWVLEEKVEIDFKKDCRSYECVTRPPDPCGCPDRRHR